MYKVVMEEDGARILLAKYEYKAQAKIWCLLNRWVYRHGDTLFLNPKIKIIKEKNEKQDRKVEDYSF